MGAVILVEALFHAGHTENKGGDEQAVDEKVDDGPKAL
jgi:hypothetical protein